MPFQQPSRARDLRASLSVQQALPQRRENWRQALYGRLVTVTERFRQEPTYAALCAFSQRRRGRRPV